MSRSGIHVGAPLRGFRGILTGVPVYVGSGPETGEAAGVR